jgi:hypothetical protein
MTSNPTYVPTRINHNPKQRIRSAAHAQRTSASAYMFARIHHDNRHYSLAVECQTLGAQLSKHARLCMGILD